MPEQVQVSKSGQWRRWAVAAVVIGLVLPLMPYLALRGYLGGTARTWILTQQVRYRFDQIFQSADPPFRAQPNAYMVRSLEGRPPGRALDVGMGQGRNALWLAAKGWNVTGFDISESGLAIAASSARSQNLTMHVRKESIEDFDYGRGQWDLILLIYAPVDFQSSEYIGRIRSALKPGGLVLVEAQVEWRPGRNELRPPGALSPGELRRAFENGYTVLDSHETQGISDWFPRLTVLGRLLAQRN